LKNEPGCKGHYPASVFGKINYNSEFRRMRKKESGKRGVFKCLWVQTLMKITWIKRIKYDLDKDRIKYM
jgi:hypothetical protein